MSRKFEEFNIDVKQFDADTELWESRKLGASAKHARRSSKAHDKVLDDALSLQLCTFRIQKDLIEQLKKLAKLEGMGYQTFMRQILTRYVSENVKNGKMTIVKKPTKIGNGSASVFDKLILGLTGINNETPVEISLGEDGKSLVIHQVSDEQSNRKKFKQALKKGNKRYGGAMKKLANK